MHENEFMIHGLAAANRKNCELHPTEMPKQLWNKDGFEYYQCKICGLMWVHPQLTDDAVSQIYATEFNNKNQKQPIYPGRQNFNEGLRLIAPYKKRAGRLLDVGTFTGHFLVAAREDGWQHVEGTEISTSAAQYARQTYQLTIHEGDLLALDLPKNTYDAITLSDVIEHVSNPLNTIQRIHELLRPGGILYLHTPHFNSLSRYYYQSDWSVFFPWHRTIFTVPAMREMLETTGFKIKILRTVGILPLGRQSAWHRYLKLATAQSQNNIPTNQLFVERTQEEQKLRNFLRPLWLGFKQSVDLPFVPLSAMGIHIGSRLVVCAEKR